MIKVVTIGVHLLTNKITILLHHEVLLIILRSTHITTSNNSPLASHLHEDRKR